jgi:hypothetical protein
VPALIDLALTIMPSHKIDIVFNTVRSNKAKPRKNKKNKERKLSINAARRLLRLFDAEINKYFLGKYYYKKPSCRRILSLLFPENIDSNLHYHGVFYVPKEFHDEFEKIAILTWLKVNKSGSLKIRPLLTKADIHQATDYCIKNIYVFQNYEQYVLSSEFWSSKMKGSLPHHRSFRP